MQLSNAAGTLLLVVLAIPAALSAAGCASCRTPADNGEIAPAVSFSIPEIPFSTREPDIFQAEIRIKSADFVMHYKTARRHSLTRTEFHPGKADHLVLIEGDNDFLLMPGRRIYIAAGKGVPDVAPKVFSFLNERLLAKGAQADFLRQEDQGNLLLYRVRLRESETSEAMVYVDPSLQLPVKAEFYSLAGEKRILRLTIEISNLRFEADKELFSIPSDFRQVSAREFYRQLKPAHK